MIDLNDTASPAPEVPNAVTSMEADLGNPASAEAAIEAARRSVARLLGAEQPDEIFFTPTPEAKIAVKSIAAALSSHRDRDQIVITNVAGRSVIEFCKSLEGEGARLRIVEVDGDGLLDADEFASSVSDRTAIVSLEHANEETGVIAPIAEIAASVKENSNAVVHVNGAGAVGRIPVDLGQTNIDIYSISGRNLRAPDDIGAIYVRKGSAARSWFEDELREMDLMRKIVGLGSAAELAADLSAMDSVRFLRDRLESEILEKIPNSRLNGTADSMRRLPNVSNISFENTNGEAIIARLEDFGIRVSTGSACANSGHAASPTLQAMNVPYTYAMGSIRFALGRHTTNEDVSTVIEILPQIVTDLRRLADP